MFDCLETHLTDDQPTTRRQAAEPGLTATQLARRYAGRSWLHLKARPGSHAQLARAREVALYLDAEVQYLPDGSLVVLGLSLAETLVLSERFGPDLAVQAHIGSAGQRHSAQVRT